MAERGAGAIVSISSMVASFGRPGMAMYGASRGAIELLTEAWATAEHRLSREEIWPALARDGIIAAIVERFAS